MSAGARPPQTRRRAKPAPETARRRTTIEDVAKLAQVSFATASRVVSGHPGVLTDSYPLLLASIFMEFPRVNSALFHGGFPWAAELGTLGKNFPNVYLDLCWLHIISPRASADALALWLELVPSHKIMGFGGDNRFVESSFGQSRVARRVTAEVLARRVDSGYLSLNDAQQLGRRILHDNAWELFQLDARWAKRAKDSAVV